MPQFTQSAAEEAAEENNALRVRVAKLDYDEANRYEEERETADTSVVDNLKNQNRQLKEKVAAMEKELSELKMMNVSELHQEFLRLNTRRAHLRNEVAGLHNILVNQRREVKKATRDLDARGDVKRQNGETNAASQADVQMFREKREELMKETKRLQRQEKKLREELDNMPEAENMEAEIRQQLDEKERKDQQIADLEAQVEERGGHVEHADDVTQLREEYVWLKEQL